MFYVYVIRSRPTGRFYTGHTSELIRRVDQHNAGLTKSTKNRGPWNLVYVEEHCTRAEAMQREKFLKSGKGREQLSSLIAKWRP